MVTTTYLMLVAVLGVALWWYRARSRREARPDGRRRTSGARLRAVLAGAATDDDLVERLAGELAAHTVVFGSSHAVPGHLGAELPVGVFEAASASRAQLTAEVLARYCALMDERCQRLGRAPFALPEQYALHLALACGAGETLTASFEPIVDVRAAARPAVRPTLTAVPLGQTHRRSAPDEVGLDEVTLRRITRAEGADGDRRVVLEVDGAPHTERRLGPGSPSLDVGRGADAALRCPEQIEDISRRHVRLTWSGGRCWAEDRHSANGTWLWRPDDEGAALVPGEASAWAPGEVLLLDDDRRVTVTLR